MRTLRSVVATLAALLAAALAFSAPAHAQTWPSKPVKIIVPFTPGSATDIIARTLAERLQASMGQPFVIENRAGAGGTIGAAAVAQSAPDGYTLLVQSSGHTVNPHIYTNLPYDTLRDFAGVTPLVTLPNVLIVSPEKGYKSVRDLVAAAKAKPGALNYASAGTGSATHMNSEKFRVAAGIDAVHVPMKGTPEAITETIAGRVDWFFAPLVSAGPMIKDGKAVALGVGTLRRSGLLPDVPTTIEAGVPGSDYTFWIGLFAPAKTPRDIVDRLQQEVVKVMNTPGTRERFASLGAEVWLLPPAPFDDYVARELSANASIVKAAGIKPN
jgi:tripartite-type tricarboxylate transporter receptor subunit TctC